MGCSPWGRQESDSTERLHFHFSLSCIGEGNGNPLRCSCLEDPRDGGAWWAVVCGVTRSRTRLKRLSSSGREQQRAYRGWYPAQEGPCLEEGGEEGDVEMRDRQQQEMEGKLQCHSPRR